MDPGLKALLEVLIRGVISKQLDRLEKKTEVEAVNREENPLRRNQVPESATSPTGEAQ